VVASTVG